MGTSVPLNYRFFEDWNTPDGPPGLPVQGRVRVYIDKVSGKLNIVDSNGNPALDAAASVSNSGNAIYATDYGVLADTQYVSDLVCTENSATVTSASANFSSADIGKIVFATNATTDVSAATSIVVVPQGTILAVVNAHTITVSVAASASASIGFLIWGSDDTVALEEAWTAASNAGLTLQLPAGAMLTQKGQFNTYPTATFGAPNQLLFIRRGFSVRGVSYNSTILIPTPNFDPTTANGPNGTGNAAFLSAPNMVCSDFQINGFGQSAIGSGFSGKYGVQMYGEITGANFTMANMSLQGWGANTSGFIGLRIGDPVGVLSGGTAQFVNVESFGYIGCYVDPGNDSGLVFSAGFITFLSVWVNVCGGNALVINSGVVQSVNGLYGWVFNNNGNSNVVVQNGAALLSCQDLLMYHSSASASQLLVTGSGSQANLLGTIIFGDASASGVIIAESGKVTFQGTTVQAHGGIPNNAIILESGGVGVDAGGNAITGITNEGGTWIGDLSVTGTPAAATNITPSSAWGTTGAAGNGVSAVSGNTKLIQFTITAAGTPGASPTVTITFPSNPTNFLATPICSLRQVGGTNFTDVANAQVTTGPSLTAVTFTLSGTPVASHTYTFQAAAGLP